MLVWFERCVTKLGLGTQTLGHVSSSSLMLRLASHHPSVSRRLPLAEDSPACRDAPAPAAAPARPVIGYTIGELHLEN